MNRRKFLQHALTASAASILPVRWVFAENRPSGLEPMDISTLKWTKAEDLPDHFTVLNTSPLNAHPAEHMLDPAITPANVPFVRWNGLMPEFDKIEALLKNEWVTMYIYPLHSPH
ncbi:MAG: hypothetical protein ACR2PX_14140 [Endozoicomonas sp.]|uniref:hypothetical protein n=1 Tax=Endozoicomonas sp. TaxID=1892382 RepID=UPI003D9ADC51